MNQKFNDSIEPIEMRNEEQINNILPYLDLLPVSIRPLAPIIERELKIELSFQQWEHLIVNENLSNYIGLKLNDIQKIISKVSKMILGDVDGRGSISNPRR